MEESSLQPALRFNSELLSFDLQDRKWTLFIRSLAKSVGDHSPIGLSKAFPVSN